MFKKTKSYSNGGSVKKTKGYAMGGPFNKKTKGYANGGAAKIGKSILRGAYKAKTKPLQAANMVVGAIAPNTRVSKLLDSVANPKILKKKGGAVK